MAATNFIPQIWAARFLRELEETLVYSRFVNNNYEGEIRDAGNTVKIPTMTTDITVGDYQTDTDIAAPQVLTGTTQDLVVDQQKYFNIGVDDVDAAQARPAMLDEGMRKAAAKIQDTIDLYLMGVFGAEYAAARAATVAAAAATPKYIEAFARLKRLMTQANIPVEGRWAVVHPQLVETLDLHFTQSGGASGVWSPREADATVRNGFAGRLLGFDLHVTNHIPTTGSNAAKVWRCPVGQGREAVTMARQITTIEAYRPEAQFKDAVKGLYVYGAKAVLGSRLYFLVIDDDTAM